MKRLTLALIVSTLALSCGSTPKVRYYQMATNQETAAAQGDVIIGVEPFLIDAAYDDQRIVYRTSEFRLDYYHYHRWSAPPGVMVADYVRGALIRTGEFRNVLTGFTADAKVMVGGRIVAFEEIDKSDSEWVARLELELYLRDARNGSLVWSKSITDEEPLSDQNPEGVAAAMSTILTRLIVAAAPEIRAKAEAIEADLAE